MFSKFEQEVSCLRWNAGRARGNLLIPGMCLAGVFTAEDARRFINIDGFLPGKEVVILGSGDIELITARRFTLEGAKVKDVCEIMKEPGGLKRNIIQCLDDFGIPLHLSHTVTKIHGKERVKGVTVAQANKNRNVIKGTEKFVKCDTLLLSVGLIPENKLTKKAGMEMSAITKGPVCLETTETNVPGIFASGNVSAVFDLTDYVAETGKVAGKSAALFASGSLRKRKDINLIPGKSVRIIFPQKFTFNSNLVLFIRVSKRFDESVFVRLLPCGIRKRQLYTRPAEMICIEIPKEKLINSQGDITISVEEAN